MRIRSTPLIGVFIGQKSVSSELARIDDPLVRDSETGPTGRGREEWMPYSCGLAVHGLCQAQGLVLIEFGLLSQEEWSGEHGVTMRIPRRVFHEMVNHAEKARPAECCGLLAGKGRLVTRIYRLDNEDGSPTSYRAAPQQQLHAFREMEDLGLDLLAIYHSHPDTESYPSPVDVEKAFFSEALHMIISLREPTSQVRAFRITRGGEINEEKFEIL